jgi:hypothetical protein
MLEEMDDALLIPSEFKNATSILYTPGALTAILYQLPFSSMEFVEYTR